MHMSRSLFYLTTALHVSGVTITHLQGYKTIVTTASGNRTPYCCRLLSWKCGTDLSVLWVAYANHNTLSDARNM
jgi:hypothetical protein